MDKSYSPRLSFPEHSKDLDYSYSPQHSEDYKMISDEERNIIESHPQDYRVRRDLRLEKNPSKARKVLSSA